MSSSPAFAWPMKARRPRATQSGRTAQHATNPLRRRAEDQADSAQSTLERHQVRARWRLNLPVGRLGRRRKPRDPNQRYGNWHRGAGYPQGFGLFRSGRFTTRPQIRRDWTQPAFGQEPDRVARRWVAAGERSRRGEQRDDPLPR